MNSFFEYTVKAGIALTVLYLFYWTALRRDTHFYLNRALLLFSVIASMILPVIHSGIVEAPRVLANLPSIDINFSAPGALKSPGTPDAGFSNPGFWKIMTFIYFSGAFIVLARLIYQAIFLHAISRLSNKTDFEGYTIVSMNTDIIPFSYFNRIFIPSSRIDESAFKSIVSHEKSHLNQWHYVDLFIIELLTVLQWFNPVVWFYEKSMKEIHEYLADEAVLSNGDNQGKYQALMVNQALGGPVFILTNQFNQSLIKKRIIMMKKIKTSNVAKLKALLVLPLIAGLLLAFSSRQTLSLPAAGGHEATITGNVSDRATGNAIEGGIIQIKGTTEGTITDRDGNYSIKISNNAPVLVFSHIGFRSQEIPVESNNKINVQLEKDMLVVDFSQGNKLNNNTNSAETQERNNPNKNKDLYVVSEELPSYPGGIDGLRKFLEENLRYPEDAKNKGVEGKVMVNFVVNADGAVTSPKIMRGVSPDLDAEAMRLVNSMKGWKPASHNGEKISMGVTMPIEFKIK